MRQKGFLILLFALILQGCGIVRLRNSPTYHAGDPSVPGYEPRGSVRTQVYPSSVPGPTARRMVVYLPEGYETDTLRYPVFYLLHGARGYETSWIRKGRFLQVTDSLFACGAAVPCIVVMPNVNQYDDDKDFDGSRFKDAFESILEIDGKVESAFRRDVVDFVDSLYRTIPDKAHRAIAGLSIGGLQSAYLSANLPDTFGYVGLYSPMVSRFVPGRGYNGFYSGFRRKLTEQFGEDPPAGYYVCKGSSDILCLPVPGFHRYLLRKGYPHTWLVTPGGHEWYNWKYYYAWTLERIFK